MLSTKVVSSNPAHGEVYSIQHYVIKFVSDLQQVSGFLRVVRFPPPIKLISKWFLGFFFIMYRGMTKVEESIIHECLITSNESINLSRRLQEIKGLGLGLWWLTPFSTIFQLHRDYVIKFVSDLQQVSGFLRVVRFSPPIKLTATM
jgi:hypothetical protein